MIEGGSGTMIYLDHNATTPLDERVLDAMLPYLHSFYGNASALHRLGRLSRSAVDTAREQVAELVGARASEVVFTSGGTEANNMAIKGLAASIGTGTLITGATEHPSISAPVARLGAEGWTVKTLPVDHQGQLTADAISQSGSGGVDIGTLMLANNETGLIHDTAIFAKMLRTAGASLHVDAVQAAGKIPVSFADTGADSLTISSHKLYGPKGVGALILRRDAPITPLLEGGGQEEGRRAGTENVAGIVGFGRAAELARLELNDRQSHLLMLRERLETGLRSIPELTIFGEQARRLPNTVLFSISGLDGEMLVMRLDRLKIAVSSGSACASGGNEPSPVLTAMGVDETTARGAVRISLGRANIEAEIDQFLQALTSLLPVN